MDPVVPDVVLDSPELVLDTKPVPDPPAAADKWANPIEPGDEARNTEYTFFYKKQRG